jgi:hypothetical protein
VYFDKSIKFTHQKSQHNVVKNNATTNYHLFSDFIDTVHTCVPPKPGGGQGPGSGPGMGSGLKIRPAIWAQTFADFSMKCPDNKGGGLVVGDIHFVKIYGIHWNTLYTGTGMCITDN